jgi:hypothetical protein
MRFYTEFLSVTRQKSEVATHDIQDYRVYKKKLNRFEIALNFAKHLFVSGFLYI